MHEHQVLPAVPYHCRSPCHSHFPVSTTSGSALQSTDLARLSWPPAK